MDQNDTNDSKFLRTRIAFYSCFFLKGVFFLRFYHFQFKG